MARTGRPKTEKPRDYKISVRFTEEEHQLLKECAAENNLTITQTIRKGILEMLKSKR